MITQEYLKENLSLSNTGVFYWLKPRKGRNLEKPAGCIGKDGYIQIMIEGVNYRTHTLVWLYHYGRPPEFGVDHINGVRIDNRVANLREATLAQNAQNRKKTKRGSKTSKYLGVSLYKGKNKAIFGKYQAAICVNYKQHHLGFYEKEIDAANAYIEAKRQLHPFGML